MHVELPCYPESHKSIAHPIVSLVTPLYRYACIHVECTFTQSCTRSCTHTLTSHLLTHSLTYLLTHSLTRPLAHSLITFTHLRTHAFSCFHSIVPVFTLYPLLWVYLDPLPKGILP